MKLSGFEFTENEEKDIINSSTAEYYRKINQNLQANGINPLKMAVTTCGHTVNYTDHEKPLHIGDVFKCKACSAITRVIETLE